MSAELTPDDLKELRKWEDARGLVVGFASSQVGVDDPAPYYESAGLGTDPHGWPRHWCGIFCLWALHQAGLALDWEWEIGRGFLYRLKIITSHPQPGDIAYFSGHQHHAIVERVGGDLVTTIDGNQAGNVVARRTRSLRKPTAFYSLDRLLGDSVPP